MLVPDRFFDAVDEISSERVSARSSLISQVSHTYDLSKPGRFIDGVLAVRQAIYKILKTERFWFPIYSSDYGVELSSLYGHGSLGDSSAHLDNEQLANELEWRISEALKVDERIVDVSDFRFTFSKRAGLGIVVRVSFIVRTNVLDSGEFSSIDIDDYEFLIRDENSHNHSERGEIT
ncbi:MAG: DUF2634 domain-containing protein [Oscillospiraceae bacterium]|nr:DUF2634 domain-containing protein [Oscillospiraceae bacterium]